MKLRARTVLVAMLATIGVWQLGAGTYIHAKAWLAQHLIANAWAREISGEHQAKPWPWADTWPIARLRIPEANVDLYVLADASGRSLAFGPGWLNDSAPLGTSGNAIIAAHRDTHFRFLRDAKPGMRVALQTLDGQVHAYEIVAGHVIDVRADRLQVTDYPALTLLTCYPFDAVVPGGPLRYTAIALPIAASHSTKF
jgi:sortase A